MNITKSLPIFVAIAALSPTIAWGQSFSWLDSNDLFKDLPRSEIVLLRSDPTDRLVIFRVDEAGATVCDAIFQNQPNRTVSFRYRGSRSLPWSIDEIKRRPVSPNQPVPAPIVASNQDDPQIAQMVGFLIKHLPRVEPDVTMVIDHESVTVDVRGIPAGEFAKRSGWFRATIWVGLPPERKLSIDYLSPSLLEEPDRLAASCADVPAARSDIHSLGYDSRLDVTLYTVITAGGGQLHSPSSSQVYDLLPRPDVEKRIEELKQDSTGFIDSNLSSLSEDDWSTMIALCAADRREASEHWFRHPRLYCTKG